MLWLAVRILSKNEWKLHTYTLTQMIRIRLKMRSVGFLWLFFNYQIDRFDKLRLFDWNSNLCKWFRYYFILILLDGTASPYHIFVIHTIQSCVTSWRISDFQNICLQNIQQKINYLTNLNENWVDGLLARVGTLEFLMIFKLTNLQYCMYLIHFWICNLGDNKEFLRWVVWYFRSHFFFN